MRRRARSVPTRVPHRAWTIVADHARQTELLPLRQLAAELGIHVRTLPAAARTGRLTAQFSTQVLDKGSRHWHARDEPAERPGYGASTSGRWDILSHRSSQCIVILMPMPLPCEPPQGVEGHEDAYHVARSTNHHRWAATPTCRGGAGPDEGRLPREYDGSVFLHGLRRAARVSRTERAWQRTVR